MYMDNIKMFAKNEKKKKDLKTLKQAVKIYSQDIRIEFGIEKCAMLIMRRGKRKMTEWREPPNQEKIRTLREKEAYKYLGILKADTLKKDEDERKYFLKRVSLENEKITENQIILQKSHQGDKIKILGTILNVDERTSTNEPENKKTHDDS